MTEVYIEINNVLQKLRDMGFETYGRFSGESFEDGYARFEIRIHSGETFRTSQIFEDGVKTLEKLKEVYKEILDAVESNEAGIKEKLEYRAEPETVEEEEAMELFIESAERIVKEELNYKAELETIETEDAIYLNFKNKGEDDVDDGYTSTIMEGIEVTFSSGVCGERGTKELDRVMDKIKETVIKNNKKERQMAIKQKEVKLKEILEKIKDLGLKVEIKVQGMEITTKNFAMIETIENSKTFLILTEDGEVVSKKEVYVWDNITDAQALSQMYDEIKKKDKK